MGVPQQDVPPKLKGWVFVCKSLAKNPAYWEWDSNMLRTDLTKEQKKTPHLWVKSRRRGVQPIFSPRKYFNVIVEYTCPYCGIASRGIFGQCPACSAPKDDLE